MGYVTIVRNVNEALYEALRMAKSPMPGEWKDTPSRNGPTKEWNGVYITQYDRPRERVLFSSTRDANPYFHFFESLWILAGRDDVAFLKQFNGNIANYSDDGILFHAPYGYRLRHGYGFDQLLEAVRLLQRDSMSRQVVLTIWDPVKDLTDLPTKDRPCNDLVFVKVRGGKVNITVCCRSNDIVWGAYGANAVQFSVIQEFFACALNLEVGTYTQISDSFHFYTENDVYRRFMALPTLYGVVEEDLYAQNKLKPGIPLFVDAPGTYHRIWISKLEEFLIELPTGAAATGDLFLDRVALPLYKSHEAYRAGNFTLAKAFAATCADVAADWSAACVQWLDRREEKRRAKSQATDTAA